MIHNNRWLRGPEFLWKELDLNSPQPTVDLDPNDNEVKKEVTTVLMTQQAKEHEKTFPKVLEAYRFTHFSSFNRLKRSKFCIQRMIKKKRPYKQYNWRQEKGPSSVRELEEAERSILKSIQHKHFSSEINDMNKLTGNEDMFQVRTEGQTQTGTLRKT